MNESSSSTGKILIVDDNQQNCELLDAYLSEEDYEVQVAYDGQSAIDLAQSFQPDVILLDIMMPRMSGYEVCVTLKKDEQTRKIQILMVTALKDVGDIEKAVEAGADDFLSKPVNRLEFITRVRSLMRVRHLEDERDRLLAYLQELEQRPRDRD